MDAYKKNQDLFDLTKIIGETLLKKHNFLALAESCTGGLLAKTITDVTGSSAWFERGFVTYSNIAKREMLSVNESTLDNFGAVSAETAGEMAIGALKHSHADIAIAITGIAGPGGGTSEKPVGLVWFGFAGKEFNLQTVSQHFTGDRLQIRQQAVIYALEYLLALLASN